MGVPDKVKVSVGDVVIVNQGREYEKRQRVVTAVRPLLKGIVLNTPEQSDPLPTVYPGDLETPRRPAKVYRLGHMTVEDAAAYIQEVAGYSEDAVGSQEVLRQLHRQAANGPVEREALGAPADLIAELRSDAA